MPPHIAEQNPILFFDSGLGGLSVLRAAQALVPNMPVVYVADYGGLPYGEKSEIDITARVAAMLGQLAERYRPAIMVIACNTASTIALSAVRAALELPIVGTVPAVKPAAAISQTRVIGLLGTAATIRQAYVDNLADEFASDATLIRFGAGELVHAAEAKLRGQGVDNGVYERAVHGLVSQSGGADIDTIVLACTHFPLVQEELRTAALTAGLTQNLQFIDGAEGIARRILFRSGERIWPTTRPDGLFLTTGPLEQVESARDALLQFGLAQINSLHPKHR
jgi:glutamate racemase